MTPLGKTDSKPKSYSPFRRLSSRAQEESDSGARELVAQGRRRDSRSPEECRPAFVKLGTVSQATGSAYMEFGRTKVLVSIFGPRESRFEQGALSSSASSECGRLTAHVTVAPFARPRRAERVIRGSPEEHALAQALVSSLTPSVQRHAFPKATLDVMGLVLEAGGSEASVLVQCASAALADSGVLLFDLVSSATVALWRGHLLLDPTDDEEAEEEGRLTLAMMPAAEEVTLMSFTGDLTPQQLSEALELATGGCQKLDELVRSTIREDIEASAEP